MLKYSEGELIGNKKKLTEIKKKFQVDKFNSVLNSPRKYPSGKINTSKHFDIFDVLEKETKVDITFFDEFTIKLGLINFFKKISTNLVYEPIIGFLHDEPYFTTNREYGLLKCNLKNKKDFQYYLISSDWFSKDSFPQGYVTCTNYFKLNQKILNKELLKILFDEFKRSYHHGKIIAKDVYFFKKLDWSKEKLKKYIRNNDVKFH